MRIVPNPAKEAVNRHRHRLDFSRVSEVFAQCHTDEPDDRPLGYEREGRQITTGRIGLRVVVLVIEPVEAEGEMAAKPISLRKATPDEARGYWSVCG